MKPGVRLAGFTVVGTDCIYLALVVAWLLALATGRAKLRWSAGFPLLALYFAALGLSLLAAPDLFAALRKLGTQVYLLSLPVIIVSLVEDVADLRRAVLAWLTGAAIAGLAGAATLILYALDVPLADYGLFSFGSLNPGAYPRVSGSFYNANLLCNYLTVSLSLLALAATSGWLKPRLALGLLSALLVTAVFTISPGLGALALTCGMWLWALLRARPWLSRLMLVGGAAGALLCLAFTALNPVPPGEAAFFIPLPFSDAALAPSIRLMIWVEAAQRFAEAPLLGHGLGTDSVDVRFLSPAGVQQQLTDAHNLYLSLATQTGIAGLTAMLALLAWTFRQARPWRSLSAGRLAPALAFAFLAGMALDGLTGSFEDGRHLWAVFGLFLAALRIEDQAASRTRSMRNALS